MTFPLSSQSSVFAATYISAMAQQGTSRGLPEAVGDIMKVQNSVVSSSDLHRLGSRLISPKRTPYAIAKAVYEIAAFSQTLAAEFDDAAGIGPFIT